MFLKLYESMVSLSSRSESTALSAGSSFSMESTGLSTLGTMACLNSSIFSLPFGKILLLNTPFEGNQLHIVTADWNISFIYIYYKFA